MKIENLKISQKVLLLVSILIIIFITSSVYTLLQISHLNTLQEESSTRSNHALQVKESEYMGKKLYTIIADAQITREIYKAENDWKAILAELDTEFKTLNKIVDTRKKFNIASDEEEGKIVIVFEIDHGETKTKIAATADSVKDVIEITENEIKPVPEMGIKYNANFLGGAIRRDEKFILLLTIEKVFSIADLSEITELEATI